MTIEPKTEPEQHAYGADDIQVLEGLEAVRKRPGMYIGSTGPRGLHHLVYEIVDNSVDEALAGYCDTIDIRILADGAVRVQDNGRGIPVDIHKAEGKSTVEVVLTVLHAGGKFGGGGYAVSGGLHGVGSSVVNALSSRLEVEVRRQGNVWRQSFAERRAQRVRCDKGEASDETGTTITFWPSAETFETIEFDYETLRARFQQMAFLNKGLRITLTDERAGAASTPRASRVTNTLHVRAGPGRLRRLPQPGQEGRARQRRDHLLRVRGHRAQDRARGGHAVDHRVHRERAHLREHDQHPRGRHPRRGLPRRADHPGQQVRPRKGHPQGEGRQPLRRRRARGPDRRHLDQARRTAVRGPDQDQARQHRGQGVRAAGRRRPARRLVRPQPGAGARDHPQGAPGRDRPAGRPQGPRDRPPQGPARGRRHARQAQGLPEQGPRALRDLHRRGRLGRRLRRAGPQPARPRRSCRCAARSSTSRRPASTAPSATPRCRP